MNTSVSILFYIKRAKSNNLGVCPIYTRVTVNAKRFEFSTNKSINPDKWSSEGSKVKGSTEEARTINSHLDYLKNQIMKLFKKDIGVTSENLKNQLFGLSETKRMLVPIFQDHNNKIKELVGKEYAPGTLERYKTSLSHTIKFLQWKYNVSDIEINKIDYAFITDYEFWLRSVKNCANNTSVKYIKNFSKIIKICLANHWIDRNPFANYKAKVKEVKRVYLSEAEIDPRLREAVYTHIEHLIGEKTFANNINFIDIDQLPMGNIRFRLIGLYNLEAYIKKFKENKN